MRPPRLAALLLLLALPAPAAAQDLLAKDAQVRDVIFNTEDRSFEIVEADGRTTASSWRVVEGTGNCCETYIGTDAAGRLYDFGGNYVNVSDDRGQNWRQIQPEERFLGGEGAIVMAPGGDVLGVGWDPYTGDQLLAFRFEAATQKWRYATMPLKSPFYDREWIGVVPGPLTVGGETVPWVSFVKGGVVAQKEEWLYSTDGLTYTEVTSKALGSVVNGLQTGVLPITPSPDLDWIQANGAMGLTPLGGGRALAEPDGDFATRYSLLGTDLQWTGFAFPSEQPSGQFHVDSRGRVHNLVADAVPDDGTTGSVFEYRLSEDGGATFRSARVALPAGTQIEDIDFRVSGALGLAAVAAHAGSDGPDRDLLYKLDVRGPQPALLRSYAIGLGDVTAGGNVLATGARFDFESLALFPDGRVAMSFMDTETQATPALAVETSEPVPPGWASSPIPGLGPIAGPPAPPVGRRPVDRAGPSGGRHRIRLKARRRGGRVIVTGTVLPRHPGHVVRIQRRARSRWVTVERVRAGRRSAFRVALRLSGRPRLRALVAGDAAGHRPGRSRAVRIG